MCTVIDHSRLHRTTVTPLDFVSCRTFLFFTRCDVICDPFTIHTYGKCYLFVKYIIFVAAHARNGNVPSAVQVVDGLRQWLRLHNVFLLYRYGIYVHIACRYTVGC